MNLPYGQLNFGLELDLDIDSQEETKANGIDRRYKLKVAKRFEHNVCNFYIRSSEWFITLAILIFVINLTNVFCKNYYLKWFYLTQQILDKNTLIKPNAQDSPTVFNLVVANKTEFALVGIFVLQFVNLILLWLYPLSTVVSFVISNLNNIDKMDVTEGRIRADHLDIELDQAPLASREPQQLKLYNMLTLAQKIQLWLIVGLYIGSLITRLRINIP